MKLGLVGQSYSKHSGGQNSSFQTIFIISNGMVGSASIVLPVLYFQFGIINAVITSLIICMISCKTSMIIINHNLTNEMDLPDTIARILGPKYKQLFNIISVLFMLACSLINIILIIQLIYPILQFIAVQLEIESTSQDKFSLSGLSYQVTGIFYIICIFPFFLLKQIGPLLKLLSYGAVSICISILFIIIKGTLNISKAQQQVEQNLKYTSNQLATLAGVFSLAFLGQSMIVPITKNNRKQKYNIRDTQIAYIWTFIVYTLIGIFGSLALTTQTKRIGTNGTTILDFYATSDYMVITIQLVMFLQLSTALPALQWMTRSRLFGLFYGPQNIPSQLAFVGFSIVFSLICLLVLMLNLNLSMVISFSGAFVGIFMEYFIPISLHFKCKYNLPKYQVLQDLDQSQIQLTYCKHNRQAISALKLFGYLVVIAIGCSIVLSQILVFFYDI